LTNEQIAELQQRRVDGDLIKTLMRNYGLSKSSVYRYLSSIPRTRKSREVTRQKLRQIIRQVTKSRLQNLRFLDI
jgi:hypothetical protein